MTRKRSVLWMLMLFLIGGAPGCSHLSEAPEPPSPPLRVLVGPVQMEAPISNSAKIYSFDQKPPKDLEPDIRADLIAFVEAKAQQRLIDHVGDQPGFIVVPFEEARRLVTGAAVQGPWTTGQLKAIGEQARADIVLSAKILDYGAVPAKYWVTGLVTHSVAGLLVLGFATGWNPAAIGAYIAWETPDIFIWGGGAYVLGWAFRPVRIEVDATQLTGCAGETWADQELKITVPHKTLTDYPMEDRQKKEIQLAVNLDAAMEEAAHHIGEELRLQPCTEDGKPAKRKKLGLFTLLGLGH